MQMQMQKDAAKRVFACFFQWSSGMDRVACGGFGSQVNIMHSPWFVIWKDSNTEKKVKNGEKESKKVVKRKKKKQKKE